MSTLSSDVIEHVSVAMPHWNAQAELAATIDSLRLACHPMPEIVVADDGSKDRPVNHAARILYLPRKDHALNPCVPMNRAIAACSRPIIVLTNPGTVFRFGMIESMIESLESTSHYVTAACEEDGTRRLLAHSTIRGGEFGRLPMPQGASFHFLAVFHVDLWKRVGGFCEEYREGQACEDNDWLWALNEHGATFVQRDDVVISQRRSITSWPEGGFARNKAIFERRWGHRLTST